MGRRPRDIWLLWKGLRKNLGGGLDQRVMIVMMASSLKVLDRTRRQSGNTFRSSLFDDYINMVVFWLPSPMTVKTPNARTPCHSQPFRDQSLTPKRLNLTFHIRHRYKIVDSMRNRIPIP